MRRFVEKCLVAVSHRLSARELLMDPFLQTDYYYDDIGSIEELGEYDGPGHFLRQPLLSSDPFTNGFDNDFHLDPETEDGWGYHPGEIEHNDIKPFTYHEDEHSTNLNISIKGKKREDGSIFLRLRITDTQGMDFQQFFFFGVIFLTIIFVSSKFYKFFSLYIELLF